MTEPLSEHLNEIALEVKMEWGSIGPITIKRWADEVAKLEAQNASLLSDADALLAVKEAAQNVYIAERAYEEGEGPHTAIRPARNALEKALAALPPHLRGEVQS